MTTGRRRSTAEFRFPLDDRRVNQVRLLLSNAVLLMTDDRLQSNHVAMAGAEMVDCALKTFTGEVCLYLTIATGDSLIRLELEAATDSAQTDLERVVSEINREAPREAYVRALKRAQEEGPATLELRLARIRYEARLELRCQRIKDQLRLIAETLSSPPPGAKKAAGQ